MKTNNKSKPIAALCTPPGVGSISVIRVSGSNLLPLIKKITCGKLLKNRVVTLSSFYDNLSGTVIDSCLFTFFKKPSSFTGEDVLEISCHGGNFIYKSILDSLYNLNVFPAKPGEFSYRAFLNNKVDLLQAEALSLLIQSKTVFSAQESIKNLTGFFSDTIKNLRKNILSILTLLEKELDFSEDEITFSTNKFILSKIKNIKKDLKNLLNTSVFGDKITSGFRVVFFGRTNAGKSSLFNHLLGENRTIISDIPGTTRDSVEAWIELGSFPVCLVDTAGYWKGKNPLDTLGIQKTINELNSADILLILDENNPRDVLKSVIKNQKNQKKLIYIKSKCDLNSNFLKDAVNVSVKTGEGVDLLINNIVEKFHSFTSINKNYPTITTTRQKILIQKAYKIATELNDLILSNSSADILVFILRDLLLTLETVVGTIYNEEVLENIFSDFCIGK